MTALLILIYCAFICLGLPDSVLGAAWPAMHLSIGADVTSAGLASMIISGGTVISALSGAWLHRKLGTGRVVLLSVLLTALALAGIGFAPSLPVMSALCVVEWVGGGASAPALNNFVALHYKARQMSWLHCFWGVGAVLGPALMSIFVSARDGWRTGYWVVAGTLAALCAALCFSLPMWRRAEGGAQAGSETEEKTLTNREALRLPGVGLAMISFFCYCGVEATAMLWSASYLVAHRGIDAATAALCASFFFAGISAGRLLTGFITGRWKSAAIIRLGVALGAAGVLCLWLFTAPAICMVSLLMIGTGFGPIYPLTIHETPARFGRGASQAVIGLQMSCAYVGSTLMPPLFGLISGWAGIGLMPVYMLLLLAALTLCTERLNARVRASAPLD